MDLQKIIGTRESLISQKEGILIQLRMVEGAIQLCDQLIAEESPQVKVEELPQED